MRENLACLLIEKYSALLKTLVDDILILGTLRRVVVVGFVVTCYHGVVSHTELSNAVLLITNMSASVSVDLSKTKAIRLKSADRDTVLPMQPLLFA